MRGTFACSDSCRRCGYDSATTTSNIMNYDFMSICLYAPLSVSSLKASPCQKQILEGAALDKVTHHTLFPYLQSLILLQTSPFSKTVPGGCSRPQGDPCRIEFLLVGRSSVLCPGISCALLSTHYADDFLSEALPSSPPGNKPLGGLSPSQCDTGLISPRSEGGFVHETLSLF